MHSINFLSKNRHRWTLRTMILLQLFRIEMKYQIVVKKLRDFFKCKLTQDYLFHAYNIMYTELSSNKHFE